MKTKLLLFIVIIIVGCNGSSNNKFIHYTSFPIEKDVKCEVYDSSLSEVFSVPIPARLYVDNDKIGVSTMSIIEKNTVHIIDRKTNTLERSFGARGKAGNEVLASNYFRVIGDKCYLSDWMGCKILVYDMNSDSNIPCEVIPLKDTINIMPSYICENGDIFYSTVSQNPLIRVYNYKTNERNGFLNVEEGEYNETLDKLNMNFKNWKLRIAYCEKSKKIAAGALMGDMLYLCDTKIGEEKFLFGPGGFDYKTNVVSEIKVQTFFVQFFKDKIYALMIDFSMERGKEKAYINVFSMEGEPLVKYNLDKNIMTFTYNESEDLLYAMTDEATHQLYKFKLD